MVVDRSSELAHFMVCHKTDEASHIADLYFGEIVKLYGVLITVVSGKGISFPPISRGSYGIFQAPNCYAALLSIHKLMAKLRSLTGHSQLF